MNKLIAFVLIIIGNFVLSLWFPWWNMIIVVMLVVAVTKLKARASWFIPAISILLLWLVQIVLMDQQTGFRSSQRIADIFGAPGVVSYLVPVISATLLAGLSGYLSYLIFHREEKVLASELEKDMTIDEYKNNTPGLEDKGII